MDKPYEREENIDVPEMYEKISNFIRENYSYMEILCF